MCERSGQPVVSSWGETRESQLSFFHEKTEHDGTAQSIVNEVIPRDRPEQPVVIPQRGARPQQFIIGIDETELELTVESSSFVNQVNHQVRKRKRISNVAGEEKTFHYMGDVLWVRQWNQQFLWKELPEQFFKILSLTMHGSKD